ncbi:pheromone processing endoprotease [Entomortierella beljakovae]|nr:pheromone processing endoprotease [Entomortierella beljakovae]
MKPVLLLLSALAILATAPSSANSSISPFIQDNTNYYYYAVKINDLDVAPPSDIAQKLGVQYIGQVGEMSNYHLFSFPKRRRIKRSEVSSLSNNLTTTNNDEDIVLKRFDVLKQSNTFSQQSAFMKRGLRKRSLENNEVNTYSSPSTTDMNVLEAIHKQLPRKRVKRAMITPRDEHVHGETQPKDGVAAHLGVVDPGFGYQWHLYAKGSYDFNDNTPIPLPRLYDDNHGTRCAGEIASARNNLCGVGVAWDAKVAGLRILSGDITDVQEAEALNYNFNETQIYSCSWGPTDDGKAMDGPTGLLLDAFINGVNKGRQGKGSIYVFATGNGGRFGDNCNFDGYTNSRYTVSIGAITRTNEHPAYSEACSAQLAVTYSSGESSWIYTCDVGKRNCFAGHSGTSAAAPIAAGIFALVLEVRPDLNWRDIQYLTVHTSVPVDENDPDWTETSVGRLFNHKYGYGKLDAYAIVERSKTWISVGPQVTFESPVITVNGDIPSGVDDSTGMTGQIGLPSVFDVTEVALKEVKFGTLEHITVTVNIKHQFRGEVEVELRSPDNIISKLAVARKFDDSIDGFNNWTFMSVKHWEEKPVGIWTLTVYDRLNATNTGTFVDWKLSLHGEIEGGHDGKTVPLPPTPPGPQPTTAPAIPEKTPSPTGDPENSGDDGSNISIEISPFIYVMFGGMFGAIGVALFLMHRHRTNPRNFFGGNMDDEEAGQRGGLLGRRGDYEFDELPTHDLGGDSEDSDDDMADPNTHRVIFDGSNLGSQNEERSDAHKAGQGEISSPLSSGEEIERESSFEVAVVDGIDEDEDDDDDFERPGTKPRSGSWDEFSTLVKSKDNRS